MTLNDCAKEATIQLKAVSNVEEVGGFIVKNKVTEEHKFVPVLNNVRGKEQARFFYDADRQQFGSDVLCLEKEGFTPVASVHTHPAFSSHPSSVDLTRLFRSFQTNFIYSVSQDKLSRYDATPLPPITPGDGFSMVDCMVVKEGEEPAVQIEESKTHYWRHTMVRE